MDFETPTHSINSVQMEKLTIDDELDDVNDARERSGATGKRHGVHDAAGARTGFHYDAGGAPESRAYDKNHDSVALKAETV